MTEQELRKWNRREAVDAITVTLIIVLFLWFEWWAAILLGLTSGLVLNVVWDWLEERRG